MSRLPPPLSVWADEPYDSQSSPPPLHCFPAGSHLPTWRLFSEYCSQEGVLKGKKKLCCWASQERALYIYFNEETGDVNKAPSFIAAWSKCLTSHFTSSIILLVCTVSQLHYSLLGDPCSSLRLGLVICNARSAEGESGMYSTSSGSFVWRVAKTGIWRLSFNF